MTSPPTHSDPPAPRKPRRLGLYLPWGFALFLAIAWSVAWLWMAGETGRRLDAAVSGLRAAGWQVAWSDRRLSGYPFRLDVDFGGLTLKDPSGWAVSLPRAAGEAYVFAPGNWIFAAPSGLAFTGRDGRAVTVTARVLRASLSGWGEKTPNLRLEGDDLVFTSSPGAKPFWLGRARLLRFETRPGPDDQGAVYLGVEGGVASPGGWLGRAAAGEPVKLVAETTFDHASDLLGSGVRAALLRWAHAGGQLSVEQLTLDAGKASLTSNHGALSVADDGDLSGALTVRSPDPALFFAPRGDAKPRLTINLRLRHATIVPASGGPPVMLQPDRTIILDVGKKLRLATPALVATLGGGPLDLSFHDGATWLGPVRIGRAPRVF